METKETKNIIIVEDENLIALDLRNNLENLGYNVLKVFASGEEAVKYVNDVKRPDIILMDIVLKGKLDGIQTAEAIHINHDIPVIYLTSYSDESTLERAYKTSMYGYIIKPYILQDLRNEIEGAFF